MNQEKRGKTAPLRGKLKSLKRAPENPDTPWKESTVNPEKTHKKLEGDRSRPSAKSSFFFLNSGKTQQFPARTYKIKNAVSSNEG